MADFTCDLSLECLQAIQRDTKQALSVRDQRDRRIQAPRVIPVYREFIEADECDLGGCARGGRDRVAVSKSQTSL